MEYFGWRQTELLPARTLRVSNLVRQWNFHAQGILRSIANPLEIRSPQDGARTEISLRAKAKIAAAIALSSRRQGPWRRQCHRTAMDRTWDRCRVPPEALPLMLWRRNLRGLSETPPRAAAKLGQRGQTPALEVSSVAVLKFPPFMLARSRSPHQASSYVRMGSGATWVPCHTAETSSPAAAVMLSVEVSSSTNSLTNQCGSAGTPPVRRERDDGIVLSGRNDRSLGPRLRGKNRVTSECLLVIPEILRACLLAPAKTKKAARTSRLLKRYRLTCRKPGHP